MGAAAIPIMLALSAASAGMAYKQSKDQKDAQDDYNRQLEKDAIRQYGELDKAEADIIFESHASSMQAQRELMKARSQVELQAAVSGTYGNSVNLAIQDLKTGFGGRMAEITFKRERQLDDINRTAENIKANPAMQADRTVSMPSYYTAFSAGMNTYSQASGVATGISKSSAAAAPATS